MKTILSTFIFFCLSKCVTSKQVNPWPPDDIAHKKFNNFTNILEKFGFETEYYKIVTKDSYVLTLFRIPGSVRRPTLIVHGFMDSSDTWFFRGEGSLGITMARLGYDVWFGNTRGNHYTRHHLFLDPDTDPLFWDFSFHEVGYYDLPAIIDTVLNITQAPKLNYIGHSQGNTALLALTSTRPEYNDKINLAITLSPVCYFHKSVAPFVVFLRTSLFAYNFLKSVAESELFGYKTLLMRILKNICEVPVIGYRICIKGIFSLMVGDDTDELGLDIYGKFFSIFPAGSSTKSIVHFIEVGRRKQLTYYDYGREKNLELYESPVPPLYDLSKVKIPIVVLAAKNDVLVALDDLAILKRKLPNIVKFVVLSWQKMNHVDFTWAKHAKTRLFPYIFEALQKYG